MKKNEIEESKILTNLKKKSIEWKEKEYNIDNNYFDFDFDFNTIDKYNNKEEYFNAVFTYFYSMFKIKCSSVEELDNYKANINKIIESKKIKFSEEIYPLISLEIDHAYLKVKEELLNK